MTMSERDILRSYIHRFPRDTLKIDRLPHSGMGDDARAWRCPGPYCTWLTIFGLDVVAKEWRNFNKLP